MTIFSENLALIRERIAHAAERAGRPVEDIRLLAVSKRVDPARIREALASGQTLFGENYIQEAREKIDEIGHGVVWHFIGALQSNKARMAAELFDVVETVDRIKLARSLDRHLAELGRTLDIFVQVNVGREEQKSGILPENAATLLEEIIELPHLNVRGLMTMPPYFEDPEKVRPYFRQLKKLADALEAQNLLGRSGRVELSMGMSGDFEVAIEEGATLVRVGTALFGAR